MLTAMARDAKVNLYTSLETALEPFVFHMIFNMDGSASYWKPKRTKKLETQNAFPCCECTGMFS